MYEILFTMDRRFIRKLKDVALHLPLFVICVTIFHSIFMFYQSCSYLVVNIINVYTMYQGVYMGFLCTLCNELLASSNCLTAFICPGGLWWLLLLFTYRHADDRTCD